MTGGSVPRNTKKLAEDAARINARRAEGAELLMKSFLTADGWMAQRPETPEYYVEVHNKVGQALSVLLADPGAAPPTVLGVLVHTDLDTRYAELNLTSATFAHSTVAIDYVVAQCVARGLLSQPLLERHRALAAQAFQGLWSRFGKELGPAGEGWEAKELLLAVAFGDSPRVIERFEHDLKLDLTEHENSHRTLIKLAYLIAKCALGSADDDDRFGARALTALTQFNYYLWIARQDLSAQVDVVTMVFATQLFGRSCGSVSATEDLRPFFDALGPASVVSAMHGLLENSEAES